MTAAEKTQLKAHGNVVVVEAKGPAAEAGLRGGDVILSINRIKVDTITGFELAVKNAGHDATLLIQREGQQSIVTITLDVYKRQTLFCDSGPAAWSGAR